MSDVTYGLIYNNFNITDVSITATDPADLYGEGSFKIDVFDSN